MTAKVVRVWIDENECIGNTLCLNDGGYLIEMDFSSNLATIVDIDREYTDEEAARLIRAAWCCPATAIYLELDDGTIVNEVPVDMYEAARGR